MCRHIAALVLTVVSLLSALPAAARCAGPSLLEELSAQERAAFDAAIAATPYGEGLVFEAVRGDTVLILIGTIHIHDDRLRPLMDSVAAHVDEADLVLLEMTPVETAQLETAMVSDPGRLFLMEGPTLPELLPEALWGEVRAAAAERMLPGIVAARYRPWFLALSLGIAPCAMPDLVAGREGLDKMVIDRAEARGIPMAALEPWDTLFSLFEEMTLEQQVEMLAQSIIPAEMHEALFVAMLDGYFAGEIAAVWELSRIATGRLGGEMTPEIEAMITTFEVALLDTRNRAWMGPILTAAATHDRIVVAAGAAHFPGEVGVLRLLEAEGFTIRRLD